VAFEIGQSVGNYRILRKLGAGGMGEVFLAEHPLIGKSVALKVIHQDLSVNKEVVTRFINEAKAVSTVGSEHIVDVHDFGVSEEGAHFFIMEYLEGETLSGLVRGGPMPIDLSLHIAAQIASGLAAAHAEGIVHRDLKPDNIMLIEKLGDPSFVKILDFGLAKMLEAGDQLTAMGVVLGTPEFMSPEAAESKGIDGRSDIYSLGVLLFQMLTGRLPFTANSMGEMMVQHVCRPPPVPRAFNPKIPPSVDQIVLRCLAKSKDDRFQSMDELRQALLNPDGYLRSSPPVPASEGAKSSVSSNHPAMARPLTPANRTMSIETPYGYQTAKRGRTMILVLVALLSAAGGTAAALAKEAPATSSADSSEPAEPETAAGDEAHASDAAATALPATRADAGSAQIPTEIASQGQDGGSAPATAPATVEPKATRKVEASVRKPQNKNNRRRKKTKEVGEDTMAPSF
jgi:serine/threonine-protein kinase